MVRHVLLIIILLSPAAAHAQAKGQDDEVVLVPFLTFHRESLRSGPCLLKVEESHYADPVSMATSADHDDEFAISAGFLYAKPRLFMGFTYAKRSTNLNIRNVELAISQYQLVVGYDLLAANGMDLIPYAGVGGIRGIELEERFSYPWAHAVSIEESLVAPKYGAVLGVSAQFKLHRQIYLDLRAERYNHKEIRINGRSYYEARQLETGFAHVFHNRMDYLIDVDRFSLSAGISLRLAEIGFTLGAISP